MSTQEISNAAVHIVGQYNDAAKTLVSAYRTGMHRILGRADSSYNKFVEGRTFPLFPEAVVARLVDSQKKVNGFLVQRLDIDTSRVVNLMDRVATSTTSGIERVSKLAEGVESPLGGRVLETMSKVQMPVAKISVKIADKVAEGAKKIEGRVSAAMDKAEVIAAKVQAAAVVTDVEAKPARRSRARKAA